MLLSVTVMTGERQALAYNSVVSHFLLKYFQILIFNVKFVFEPELLSLTAKFLEYEFSL